MSSDNLMKPAYCSSCGAPVEGAQPGQMHKCANCGQTSRMAADPPAPESFVKITANTVKANRIVGHDLVETHYHGSESTPPEAEAELLAALVSELELKCPYCQEPVDEDGKPGRKYICGECGKKSFITVDGQIMTWLAAVQKGLNLPATTKTAAAPDLGGDGEGVNIDAGDGDVDVPGDAIGRLKI